MTGHEPITLSWLWSPNLGHRPVVPRLILGVLYRLSGDFRAGMYLNAGMLSTAAVSLILLARRLSGRTRMTDAVLPLAILSLGQWECLSIGFALNLVLTGFLACLLVGVVGRSNEVTRWHHIPAASGILALLS